MTKVDIRRLDSVTTNDTTATQLINENFEALQTAIENTLSRDGSTPNFMDANLDLNSHKIINAGTPTDNTDLITKEYFDQNVGDASASAAAAAASAQQAQTYAASAGNYSSVATGAADTAQAARDFIESDPGFQAVSTDLLDENSDIKQVADDLTNIDTVAGIASNVTAVANIDSDVTTVAGISSDVTAVAVNNTDISTVATDITNVNAVADDLTNIDAVNANKTNIDTVAGIDSDVTTVAGIASDVSAVADNNSDISTVADDLTNIDTVSSNITNVNTVADISSDVTTVAGISTDVSAIEDIASDVTTVAGISTDVSTVADSASNIATVITDLTNIDTVAADINSVVAVAADLTNIDNASSYAAESKQWAVGDPTEPSAGSAKYWAGQAAAGQVQADWTEADTNSKAYIKNKPTVDISPTQNSTNLVQSGGVFTSVNNLQNQIDAIVASSDVFDIVADYTALQAYNISTVPVNDIIKVLVDSTHDNAATYYRCVESGGVKSWSYVGSEGAYYTKGEADNKFSTITATGNSLDYTGNTLSLENSSGTVLSSVTINSTPDLDNKSITLNESSQLQTIGVMNRRSPNGAAIKFWTGTRQQYDAILSKNANTQYMITDTGEIYLGTTQIANLSSVRNIGEIIQSTIPLTDAGLHLLDGSVISGSGSYSAFVTYIASLVSSYPDLFETEANWQQSVTTYGVCGKFVYDSVNNTVRLPKITGFTEGTTDITTLGDLIEAGLPDITGYIEPIMLGNTPTGCFDFNERGRTLSTSGSNCYYGGTSFYASRSNSIYGKSTTVQPQAIKVLYYIVIATSTKTNIEVDIDEVMTDLNLVSNQYRYDGQWISSVLNLASSFSFSGDTRYEYDLSTYLPNDNYNYEVLGTIYGDTLATSGKYVNMFISSSLFSNTSIGTAVTRTSSYMRFGSCFTVPVGTDRKIAFYDTGDGGTITDFYLAAYRRIGTNS